MDKVKTALKQKRTWFAIAAIGFGAATGNVSAVIGGLSSIFGG